MKIVFWPTAWEDYLHWQMHDPKTLDKINALIAECHRQSLVYRTPAGKA